VRKLLENLSLCFAAGVAGGFANSLVVWWCGVAGVTAAADVKLAPDLTSAWLYPRLVWGGLWGFLFLLPLGNTSYVLRGLLFSLVPTIFSLFYFLPAQGKGILGIELGAQMPMFVVLFNAVWGAVAALWLKFAGSGVAKG